MAMTLPQALAEIERQKAHNRLLDGSLRLERERRKELQRIIERMRLKLCKVGHRVSCSCFIDLR